MLLPLAGPAQTKEQISVDAAASTTPFPHFWEQTFGSGRAVLALRQDYRDDLRAVHQATGFSAVRFHGIFNDEVGVYDPDAFSKNPGLAAEKLQGVSKYNFSYVDQIYDGLLDIGVKPFVEISFMPKKLSSQPDAVHPFWYHPNVAPPKDYAEWDAMITAFAQHIIARYGIEEIATWNFEVWNEPNLDFWGGRPNQPTYFELYDHTARALKAVSPRLIVGGPATAQAGWVGVFLKHCHDGNIPVDFASTHVYGNDDGKSIFGITTPIARNKMVPMAVKKVHDEIASSAYPRIPLFFSEYNASYANEPNVTDTVYMGAWLADTIRQVDGIVDQMAYWDFSDVFEEQGVTHTPFYGGFGVIAERQIHKPAFNAFAMLHELGTKRIAVESDSALATLAPSGSLVLALWNYADPYGEGATYTPPPASLPPSKTVTVHLAHVPADAAVIVERLDADHGNVLKTFDQMSRPATPSRQQIAQLRAAGMAAPPETMHLAGGSLELTIPAQGLVLLKVQSTSGSHPR